MIRKTVKLIFGFVLLIILAFWLLRNPDKSLEELMLRYTDSESEWIEINGLKAHFKKEGRGRALILIHGTGASLHTWDGWVRILEDSLTIYRMDLPAFGLTGPAPDRDYSIEAYIDFLDRFAIQQGLHSFSLAGNSLGGQIAWEYAVSHPEKVSKLVLLDAAGYPSKEHTDALAFKIAVNPVLRPILKHITPKKFIQKNLQQVYHDDSKINVELVSRYHDMALRAGNRQAFIDRVHTLHPDHSNKIKEIKCPTLIMWGKNDTWADVADAQRFGIDIPNSRVIIYEDAGHIPMEELPIQTAQDARRFILE